MGQQPEIGLHTSVEISYSRRATYRELCATVLDIY